MGHSQAQVVYSEDFSSPGSVSIEPLDGLDSGQPFEGNSPEFEFGDFASTGTVTLSVSGGVLNLGNSGGSTAAWHGIDTSGWAPNDYTVSFSVGGLDGSDTYLWGLTGGSGMTGSGSARVRTGASQPRFRDTQNGATAVDLTSGNLDSSNAADYLAIAGNGLQSFDITLTESEVGTAGDYLMIGWGMDGSSDGITIDDLQVSVVPEPSSIALLGLAGLAFYLVLRRK